MAQIIILDGYEVSFHRVFKKQYKKLPKKIAQQFDERLGLLLENPDNQLLHVHHLKGMQDVVLSMNVSGDYRAHFILDDDLERVLFIKIGTHSELYT